MQMRLLLRFISKNPEIYFLKILTLSIAVAALILVSVFSLNEFGYDRFHKNYDQIFRLIEKSETETFGRNKYSCQIPEHIYSQLNADRPGVFARIKVLNELRVLTSNSAYHNQQLHIADPEITDIFTFTILHGALEDFKENQLSMLISTNLAEQYFGKTDVDGKEISLFTFDDTLKLTVSAVYEAFPSNSHQNFGSFIYLNPKSLKTLGFNLAASEVYSLKADGANIGAINSKDKTYSGQPISEIYFGPRMDGEDVLHGDIYSMIILVSITAFILFLALTSFINLTSLALPHRVKELAIKKLAGHTRLRLVMSFIGESLFISVISLVIGMGILWLCWENIEAIEVMNLPHLIAEQITILILVLIIFSLMLALSPLLMVGKFIRANTIRLLSSEAITFPRFKKVIIIAQLGISIFLIVSAIVINRQVTYSLVKEPGRNNYQVVYVNYPDNMTYEQLTALRAGWKKSRPNIVNVMAVSQLPNQISSRDLSTGIYSISVDSEFNNFFDLEMIEGGWFGPNDGDSMLVVNESAFAKLAGTAPIRGVYKDISGKFNLPEKPIQIVREGHVKYNFLCISILEVDILKTLAFLERYFESNGQKAEVRFMDKKFGSWLDYQIKLNAFTNLLTIIAGLLSCCAIYGLSISVVRDKLKQIAIRKICGADLIHIIYLLVKEFATNLFIAVLIFAPITYIILKELLRAFVYSTQVNWLDPMYPLAYCGMVIAVLCTWQALTLNRADLSGALKE